MADPGTGPPQPAVMSQEFDVANQVAGRLRSRLADAGFVVTVTRSGRAGNTILSASRHLQVQPGAIDQVGETHRRVAVAAADDAGVSYTLGTPGSTLSYVLDPTNAIAAVVQAESADGMRQLLTPRHGVTIDDALFRGTAFAFRDPSRFITARHCVDGASPSDLVLSVGQTGRTFPVQNVCVHESADLAVLDLGLDVWPPAAPFMGLTEPKGLGMTLSAYGLPEDQPGAPVPRLFRGHVQRFIDHQSQVVRGASYLAAELSFPVPVGLSGGPCFAYGERLHDVFAVAVENIRSATYSSETETIRQDDSSTETIRERDVVSYGIALVLAPFVEWLDEVCPVTVRDEFT